MAVDHRIWLTVLQAPFRGGSLGGSGHLTRPRGAAAASERHRTVPSREPAPRTCCASSAAARRVRKQQIGFAATVPSAAASGFATPPPDAWNPDNLPADWAAVRQTWLNWHAVRTGLAVLAFISLLAAQVVDATTPGAASVNH